MPLPRRLDHLLADAEVLTDRAGPEEVAASRRRIEADYAALARRRPDGTTSTPGPAHSLAAFLGRSETLPGTHAQAARDLRELSALVLHGADAADNIARLATTHQINPDGAMTFACLLHLADREDGAEFLWQFAAGAGKPASAACLYLLHLKRGDLRDARHWGRQAAVLEAQELKAKIRKRDCPKDRISARRRTHSAPCRRPAPDAVMLLHTLQALQPDDGDFTLTAFQARTGALPQVLTQAVQRLETESHPGYGPITWPDQNLANTLQETLAA
jgi:hypothetical protein